MPWQAHHPSRSMTVGQVSLWEPWCAPSAEAMSPAHTDKMAWAGPHYRLKCTPPQNANSETPNVMVFEAVRVNEGTGGALGKTDVDGQWLRG